ncbi:MAG: DHH family phosphoesterase [Erysipelotrichaceae bacterium]|nr:DHH family phosphoesterase [Erysipelotrichaceae bacterium]
MSKRQGLKALIIAIAVATVVALGIAHFVFELNIILASVIALVYLIITFVVFFSYDSLRIESNQEIKESIDKSISDALKQGNVGILVYDELYEITWMSDFFEERKLYKTGEKLLTWLPEIQDVIQGNSDRNKITINDNKYSVHKLADASVLIFKDITKETNLSKMIADNAYVLGLLSYDNYDEINETEDDNSYINANIKMPVMEYFKKYGVVYKTLRSSKMLLILNEKQYEALNNDHFSILNVVRRQAKQGDLDITLSLSFARGSDDLDELNDEAQALIELAQSRGGDQVAVRKIGEDATFFGGSSEAKEKQSRVKVRVIFNSIKDLVNKSSNVIIVGHKYMDADCVGAALCMSNIVNNFGKKAYIVSRTGGIEPTISEVIYKYRETINEKHSLINQEEAISLLDDNSLVIMVDHHSKLQSNSQELLEKAKRILIVDHHRRKADLDISPLMVYVEASASSTCELTAEFLAYLSRDFELTSQEANIMYLGILIDTDRFRVRTGVRTFDSLKQLRHYGADPAECDDLVKEPYENILKRSRIINAGKAIYKNIYISEMSEDKYSRTIASQAADAMVKTKEAEAAFVICNSEDDEVIVTARSNGGINVQAILERMHGGGHMTAAGLQRTDTTVAKVTNELLSVLKDFNKED